MKATKIMVAVFGALLVAALFTGAAAAATVTTLDPTASENDEMYVGSVYAYGIYNITGIDLKSNATWVNGLGQKVVFELCEEDGFYIDGAKVEAEGDYYLYLGGCKYHVDVKQPTAVIQGIALDENAGLLGSLIGSTIANDKYICLNDLGAGAAIAFTNPEKTLTSIDPFSFGAEIAGSTEYGPIFGIKQLDLGVWTAQAYFMKGTDGVEALGGISITMLAPDYILGNPYYFTVVSSDDAKKIATLNEEIIQGGYATIVVTAPTGYWNISVENGCVPAGQPLVEAGIEGYFDLNYYVIHVPASGTMSFTVQALTSSDLKVRLLKQDNEFYDNIVQKSVTVKVKSGSIAAAAEKDSVYIGNDLDLAGTNDLGGNVYFFIKGTNFPLSPVYDGGSLLVASGKVWDATIATGDLKKADNKKVDAGTYTIYIVSNVTTDFPVEFITDVEDFDDSEYVDAYATVSVALKQPFISITDAPEVAVQGEKLTVKGTAEGEPNEVQFYIFGTNFFKFGSASVTDGEFSVELKKEETKKENMAAGQYFLVIQHPMYDKLFNVWAEPADLGSYNIMAAATADEDLGVPTVVFNTADRQSANAAKALTDELDKQYIDDMYAKASFILAGPTSYIDPVPSQITKGQVLTVSGTTTGHTDEVVTVELLSTAFAAIPKEAVGSASFVALTTKIGEDGVWSISFDTSSLNADTYTCSVAVGQLDAQSSKITIVDGAQPQPTQTAGPGPQPTVAPTAQPTSTPKTPGFGALAALAGLGAVAVLLLRRQ